MSIEADSKQPKDSNNSKSESSTASTKSSIDTHKADPAETFLSDLDRKIIEDGKTTTSLGQDKLITDLLKQQQNNQTVWILNHARAGHYRDDTEHEWVLPPKLTLHKHLTQAKLAKMANNVLEGDYDE